MKNFKQYYEARTLINEAKANTHLTHLEELVLTQGERGYGIARGMVADLLSHLQGKSKRKVNTSVKWDGAPAIFAGKHPETGAFFVAKKSLFNKTPLFYTSIKEIKSSKGKRVLESPFRWRCKKCLEEGFADDIIEHCGIRTRQLAPISEESKVWFTDFIAQSEWKFFFFKQKTAYEIHR